MFKLEISSTAVLDAAVVLDDMLRGEALSPERSEKIDHLVHCFEKCAAFDEVSRHWELSRLRTMLNSMGRTIEKSSDTKRICKETAVELRSIAFCGKGDLEGMYRFCLDLHGILLAHEGVSHYRRLAFA